MIRLSEMTAPLPPAGAVADPEVVAEVEAYAGLLERAGEAQREVTQADRKLAGAREADLDRYADALREGKDDPGRKPVQQAERDLEGAKRRAEATGRAALGARDDLERLVAGRRDVLVETADAQVAQARRGFAEALDVLEAAAGEFGRARAARAWAAGFPDRAKAPGGLVLAGVRGPNGDDYLLAAAVASMRELTLEPDRT